MSPSVTLENKERLGSTRGLPKAPASSFPRDPPTSEMKCWGSSLTRRRAPPPRTGLWTFSSFLSIIIPPSLQHHTPVLNFFFGFGLNS